MGGCDVGRRMSRRSCTTSATLTLTAASATLLSLSLGVRGLGLHGCRCHLLPNPEEMMLLLLPVLLGGHSGRGGELAYSGSVGLLHRQDFLGSVWALRVRAMGTERRKRMSSRRVGGSTRNCAPGLDGSSVPSPSRTGTGRGARLRSRLRHSLGGTCGRLLLLLFLLGALVGGSCCCGSATLLGDLPGLRLLGCNRTGRGWSGRRGSRRGCALVARR
mmetsp:Transcript_6142/g.17998  ORF Transcript_6142/g.17998 Transcript_6142/m.17998 type:complete len:217 (+) Transcript_6142:1114-1764(+)